MPQQMLQEVIYLPEYEAPEACDDNAIRYMSQWDCGEYSVDPIPRSELHSTAGHACENDEYLLLRYPDGSMVLYAKIDEMEVCHHESNKYPMGYRR